MNKNRSKCQKRKSENETEMSKNFFIFSFHSFPDADSPLLRIFCNSFTRPGSEDLLTTRFFLNQHSSYQKTSLKNTLEQLIYTFVPHDVTRVPGSPMFLQITKLFFILRRTYTFVTRSVHDVLNGLPIQSRLKSFQSFTELFYYSPCCNTIA